MVISPTEAPVVWFAGRLADYGGGICLTRFFGDDTVLLSGQGAGWPDWPIKLVPMTNVLRYSQSMVAILLPGLTRLLPGIDYFGNLLLLVGKDKLSYDETVSEMQGLLYQP